MEKEKTFIVKPPEKQKSPKQYELSEMHDDLVLFPEEVRPLVEKHLEGQALTLNEHGVLHRARNAWWQEKYGFSYDNKIAREEVLRRKYASAKEMTEQENMQKRLFQAFRDNNAKEIASLKKYYEENYSDQLEGIEILFGLNSFFETQKFLDTHKKDGWNEEVGQRVQSLTEYQFLLSDFVRHNARDKEFLSVFWEALERNAETSSHLKIMHQLRRSVLSGVALMKVFEALGKKPFLSHPSEDAFRAIDMWIDAESAVQVKGAFSREDSLSIVDTDSIAFPAVEVKESGSSKLFNSHFSRHLQTFHAKIKNYEAVVGKKLRGYFVVIPYEKFDFVTGEPDEEIIQEVRHKLRA
ncbi:hypothetical protein KGQ34_04690, partial [Patescibacteria group bacterium]|nr:hypothetical protein [Patescibacteria group bacterium]